MLWRFASNQGSSDADWIASTRFPSAFPGLLGDPTDRRNVRPPLGRSQAPKTQYLVVQDGAGPPHLGDTHSLPAEAATGPWTVRGSDVDAVWTARVGLSTLRSARTATAPFRERVARRPNGWSIVGRRYRVCGACVARRRRVGRASMSARLFLPTFRATRVRVVLSCRGVGFAVAGGLSGTVKTNFRLLLGRSRA